jgi:hypothetical protein
MMIRIQIIISMLLFITSCSSKETFKVEGRINDETLNGSKVYLVALDGPISKNVDSTIISEGNFRFEKKADSLCVKILRVPVRYPNAIEDLVVVTEPGILKAVLSYNSHGEGTRLNNVLQQWKENKRITDSIQYSLILKEKKEENKEAADSLRQYSEVLYRQSMSGVVTLINENMNNGIGLLLFKVYYNNLPVEVRKRILEKTGDLYTERDAQLKLLIENERNAGKL